jgi:hypothetical protein
MLPTGPECGGPNAKRAVETARAHSAGRWCGGVAVRRTGPAERADAPGRHTDELGLARPRGANTRGSISGRALGAWLDRYTQRHNRDLLGCGRCRPVSSMCGATGSSDARRDSGGIGCRNGAAARGNPRHSNRLCTDARSGRRRLCHEPRTSWRQCYRLHSVRVRNGRQMAGAAQSSPAESKTSDGAARS